MLNSFVKNFCLEIHLSAQILSNKQIKNWSFKSTFFKFPTERPDPPSALEVIEIGSRSIKLSWHKAFDGNSPIREYIIQYQPVSHGILEDDWEPTKMHNISHMPGSFYGPGTNPSQSNGIARFDTTVENQEVAQVGGLHPAVTYKFRVFAINFIDTSEPTGPAVAKTQEEGKIEMFQSKIYST